MGNAGALSAEDEESEVETTARSAEFETAGKIPDPAHAALPCPWPCFRSTPVDPTSLKSTPHTEHKPELEPCDV